MDSVECRGDGLFFLGVRRNYCSIGLVGRWRVMECHSVHGIDRILYCGDIEADSYGKDKIQFNFQGYPGGKRGSFIDTG